jgi:peptidyl-prolyl cis-trans isomerase SurA
MTRIARAAIAAALLAGGCKVNTPTASVVKDPVIATIGQVPVYRSEFQYVYDKNPPASDSVSKDKSVREYLDLYLNFRLKVLDAESLGLDTLSTFREELSGYKEQLAEPYLMDSTVTAALVREAYEHMKEEIHASHLLIGLPKEANPEDTLKAYNQVVALRKQLEGGEDFSALARSQSQDPSAQTNGGDLGWFTALQMVYPFEKAAYQTPKGSISQPVRTNFGYHLIKVTDRRPSRGRAQVAHIMVRTNPEVSAEDAKAAKQKIDEIHQRLQKGEDWDKLAAQFSEDGSSRTKGGVLPPFGTGNMIPPFEDAAFALNKPGDISSPVLTPYGWHIIKLIEKKDLEPFSEMEQPLKQRVGKDSRSELNRTLFLQRLRRENRLNEDAAAKTFAFSKLTDSLRAGKWDYTPDKSLERTLFTIGNETYPVAKFFEFIKTQQEPKPTISTPYYAQLLYNNYLDQSLWDYEKKHLEEKHPDYRFLVKEYRDGILLFQRMEDQVWSKSLSDSTGQKAFFEKNRDKYQWGRRVKATVYNAADATVLAELKETLKKPHFPVSNPAFAELNFDKSKSALDTTQREQLQKIGRALQQDRSLLVEITGFADPRETEATSGKRAKAAADYLVANGADITRIITKDAGRFKPVSKTHLRKNARVTFALYSDSKTAIERSFNARKPLNLEITEGVFQKGDNPVIDEVTWQKGNYTLDRDGRKYYVEITAVEEPRPRTFDESRGAVISDYQNHLEKEWLQSLRQKYPVVVNEQEVAALTK